MGLMTNQPHLFLVSKIIGDLIVASGILLETGSSQRVFGLVGLFACATLFGCSPSKPWETTHPTTGQVTYKGAPVKNADLSFFPEDRTVPDSVRPKAKTSADGKFVAWTNVQGDGVPVGNYKVTIVHNEVSVSKDTIVAKPNDLPAKYASLDTTDLQVQIKAGNNELRSFDLK